MPTIQVDDKGTKLYYEDTGRPVSTSDNYLTVVLIHGMIIHGAIFRKLFEYTEIHGVRLVAVNMRNYPGSTPFRSEELAEFISKDRETQSAGVRKLGHQLAVFLDKFISMNHLPEISSVCGKRRGGLAIFGWSMGNVVTLAFLGNAYALEKQMQNKLAKYFRTIILYDPPGFVYGVAPPEGLISPSIDPAIPPERRVDIFLKWISRYDEPVPSLSEATPDFLRARRPLSDPSDPRSVSTIERMTSEELRAVADTDAFARWAPLLRIPHVFRENTRRAFFDTQGVWKDVGVVALWSELSPWIVHVGARAVAEQMADPAYGGVRRKLVIEKVPDVNHFMHWDQPQFTMRLMMSHLH